MKDIDFFHVSILAMKAIDFLQFGLKIKPTSEDMRLADAWAVKEFNRSPEEWKKIALLLVDLPQGPFKDEKD